jgi:carbonic anhydrase
VSVADKAADPALLGTRPAELSKGQSTTLSSAISRHSWKFDGEKSSKNAAYVDAVARTNVVLTLAEIRRRSPILEDLEKKGSIMIAGAMYTLSTGMVDLVS